MGEDFRFVAIAVITLLVSACGGGGGGSGAGMTVTTTPAANVAPNAAFTLQTSGTTAPLVVTADASASLDSDGQIITYVWDFDGTTAIGRQAQFTFEDPGQYSISLTVTDNNGATASAVQAITAELSPATASISGTVRILSSTVVDTDVNDRLTVNISNNQFDTAQPLPSTVTLGGFANIAGTGEPTGNLFRDGDPADFYQISLNGGEVIVLSIAEANADLDLLLWDDQRNIVDASLNLGGTESLSVAQAGNYFIEVLPFQGASNYVLFVGQDATSTAFQSTSVRLSDDFIPGELLVKHRPTHFSNGQTNKRAGLLNSANMEARFKEPADLGGPGLYSLPAQNSSLKNIRSRLKLPTTGILSEDQLARLHTMVALKNAQQDPSVVYAELNRIVTPHAVPNDSFFGSQWHYQAINLPIAWDTSTGSNEVIVAVLDSGVLLDHPDLTNKLVDGYDFISSTTRSLDGDGIDDDPSDPGDRQFGGSSSFHGTHVAGTVGAQTDNATGVAGVAWQTKIMPVRVLGKDGGSTFDIVQAVRYAAGLSNNSGQLPSQRADIINLSLGSSFSSQSEQDAYTAASQAGVLIIASAGNESSTLPAYPAAYDNVISVSATTITNTLANYSNTGSSIDVAAPGGSNATDINGDGLSDGVLSTSGDDSSGGTIEFVYGTQSGTSMAAPHVSGIAALMKAIYPPLTPTQFTTALIAGDLTDDLGAPGRDDQYGFGLINAQKAVVTAARLANGQGSDPGPILVSTASTINFGSFLDTLTFRVQNIGTGEISITNVSASQTWIGIDPPASSDGLGEYTITIDRSGLSDGSYLERLTVDSDSGSLQVNLIVQVARVSVTADAGLFYIIVVDSNDAAIVPAQRVNATLGEYHFSIDGIPAGQYRLFAGSDADDDAVLCDAGEACGAYPTLDSPTLIAINEDLTELDFDAGFRVNLTSSSALPQQNGTTGDGEVSTETNDLLDDNNPHALPISKP